MYARANQSPFIRVVAVIHKSSVYNCAFRSVSCKIAMKTFTLVTIGIILVFVIVESVVAFPRGIRIGQFLYFRFLNSVKSVQ